MTEFKPWPKTPRLFRDVVITEKIDGTNAAVHVDRVADYVEGADVVSTDAGVFRVGAQSRNRIITPDSDNFGFASWVRRNAAGLASALGEGTHFGEWWGSGIQRGYGLTGGEKRFSLFNVARYDGLAAELVPGLGVVPVLYTGPFDTFTVGAVLRTLKGQGSIAAPGFMRPEGIIVFHSAARSVFKVLAENDDTPKGAAA